VIWQEGKVDILRTLNAGGTLRANHIKTPVVIEVGKAYDAFITELERDYKQALMDGKTPLSAAYFKFWEVSGEHK